ncbi:MAG: UbiA family prenyltransferase [Candidatus Pacebacteria bacterium]|nr:UbiA family prenyltransferase [Candidatus Paceibacterota bacterium]
MLKYKIIVATERLESLNISFSSILLLFGTSIFFRTFLENFTNSNNAGFINNLIDTFFHYPLWYVCVFLSIILVLHTLTSKGLRKITKLIAFGSFLILLPPIIDIVVYGYLGHPYNFIAGDYTTLWRHFSNLLFSTNAVGIGIKIEIIIATLGIASYVFMQTRHIWKSILGGLLTYVAIFFFLSIPVHTMALFNVFSGDTTPPIPENVVAFFTPTLDNLGEQQITTDILNTNTAHQQYFSQKISIVFVLCIVLLLAATLWVKHKTKFAVLIKNIRPIRLFHWYAFAILGIYFGVHSGLPPPVINIYFILDLVALCIATTSIWLFSVWDNDEEDIAIDQISNSDRPLVNQAFSRGEWSSLKKAFLFFGILTSWLAGYYIFTLFLLFLLTYHHYSRKPLRFKRILGLSSIAVPLNTLLVFSAGFFIVHPGMQLDILPLRIMLGIFVLYYAMENVKNLKDTAGDRASGITTFAVVFGEKTNLYFSLLAIPLIIFSILFLKPPLVLAIAGSIIAGLAVYFINKKPYRELPVFLLYLVFLVILLVYLWFFT